LFPKTVHFSKIQSRSSHDLLIKVLLSNAMPIIFHLFLPKVNLCVSEFKFIKAPAQASSVQDQCNYISAFHVAQINQNRGEDFVLFFYKTTLFLVGNATEVIYSYLI